MSDTVSLYGPFDFFSEEELAADPILNYLVPNPRLPENLQFVAGQFAGLAANLLQACPRNPERTVAFRKLLEAKDCAVRSML